MSSNFAILPIDITEKHSKNQINIDPKYIEKFLKKQKDLENHNNKTHKISQDPKNSINLEKAYKDSLFLLDLLNKNAKKNILEKYDIKNNLLIEKNSHNIINNSQNDIIKNILMKKKF
ncbi:hypothetical protein D9V67_03015 [Buchnera aphidicola (Brachycaudus cardui)]|uniref:Uncharacterized protein n=1 Tax=Buchnera aphidicola (Brachycaudus cardui) TaxID=557993 RepID=A0A4D6XVD6_9GAMM|nr:hypothetical protein [Buchnera aphidicola]QCI20703.1 hypothetical protein D9V67_03015 [Buchnera aphidicola (Brachycaudus cardui)]